MTSEAPVSARMAGEERRAQILAVAVSLFSKRGFRGTTTKEIAQAAGVSEAMVFRHFATKEELYTAILNRKCSGGRFEPAEMAADAIQRKDDRAVFESLALGALNYHENDPEFQRLLLHSALEKHELAQIFFDEFVRRVYLDVIGLLPTIAEQEAFLADQRPDRRQRLIDTLLDRPEHKGQRAEIHAVEEPGGGDDREDAPLIGRQR